MNIFSVIQRPDIQFMSDASSIIGMGINLKKFKHSSDPVVVFIPINVENK